MLIWKCSQGLLIYIIIQSAVDLLKEKGQTVNRNGAVQYYTSAMLADTKCVVGASSGLGGPYRSANLPGP